MQNERKINVHWDGPIEISNLGKLAGTVDLSQFRCPNYVIYLICGTHGLYGRNVPLYIGSTFDQCVINRLGQPGNDWLKFEPDTMYCYAAAICEFSNWSELDAKEEYERPEDKEIIIAVEALLIYAHRPAYNTNFTTRLNNSLCNNIRLFNTGQRTTLYPEVSGFYWTEGASISDASTSGFINYNQKPE